MTPGVIVSLFDESGNAVRPWAEAGHTCYCFDRLNTGAVEAFASGGSIARLYADLTDSETVQRIIALKPVHVMGFPPCTDLAVSGAKHFETKAAADPLFQYKAVALCRVVETVGETCGVPWFAENPISMLATLWRKPDYYFHPWQFGGYLPVGDTHPRWPQYIVARDAYKKLTALWVGGGWKLPRLAPVAPAEGYSIQFKKLGGKSAKTKRIRSETPRGFAIANFENTLCAER